MSNAVFHDTITLYLAAEDGYARRVIPTVKVEYQSTLDGDSATVYLPLHGRRCLDYVAPEAFDLARKSTFTVVPGMLLVRSATSKEIPPSSALTVTGVALKAEGSRRLHHLKITAKTVSDQTSDENEEEEEIL